MSYRGVECHGVSVASDRGCHIELEIPFSKLIVQQLFGGIVGENCGHSLALISPCHHWITRCFYVLRGQLFDPALAL